MLLLFIKFRDNGRGKNVFYDSDSIEQEFGEYGLTEISEIVEPHKNMENKPPFKFLMVKCQKER